MPDHSGTVCLKPEADAMIGGYVAAAGMFASRAPPMEVFLGAMAGGVVGSTVVKLLNKRSVDFNGAINSGINGVGGYLLIDTLTSSAIAARYN